MKTDKMTKLLIKLRAEKEKLEKRLNKEMDKYNANLNIIHHLISKIEGLSFAIDELIKTTKE